MLSARDGCSSAVQGTLEEISSPVLEAVWDEEVSVLGDFPGWTRLAICLLEAGGAKPQRGQTLARTLSLGVSLSIQFRPHLPGL